MQNKGSTRSHVTLDRVKSTDRALDDSRITHDRVRWKVSALLTLIFPESQCVLSDAELILPATRKCVLGIKCRRV